MSAWTKDRPAIGGHYWVRTGDGDAPDLVRVERQRAHGPMRAVWCDGGTSWGWVDELAVEWQRAEPKP